MRSLRRARGRHGKHPIITNVTVLHVRSTTPWWTLLRALCQPRLYRMAWRMWRERPSLLREYPDCDWRWLRLERLP